MKYVNRCTTLLAAFILFQGCLCQEESTAGHGANVLISAIYGEGSHFLCASKIGESLVKRGHNVTFLVGDAYKERASDPKYKDFSFEVFTHALPAAETIRVLQAAGETAFEESSAQFRTMMAFMAPTLADNCKSVLTDVALMRRLEAMDAIAMDISWPCAVYIKAMLDKTRTIPKDLRMIGLSPTTGWSGYQRVTGSTWNHAYQPDQMTGFTNRMDFSQRLRNFVTSTTTHYVIATTALAAFREMEAEVGLENVPNPYTGFTDFDLYLTGNSFASDFPVPMAPNLIAVGGLTASPAAPLQDQALEDFMQSSGEEGVVVFTLGTYLASITTFRPEIVRIFAEAFAKLPQKVLWQLKELPDWELPPNVKTMPWLPQNDLLGHSKTRVLMWQGGNNGFHEACYHGVPVVVIPLHADQRDVAARVEVRGLGKKIDKLELNPDIIYDTLMEVINNPSYKEVAMKVSAIYHDQPMTAPDRAAFWIEHVIKFGGSYLRSPAHDLNFIQYHLIDVLAFLTAIVVLVLAVVYYILRGFLSLLCRMLGRGGSTKLKND